MAKTVVKVWRKPRGWLLQLSKNGEALGSAQVIQRKNGNGFEPVDTREEARVVAEKTRDLLWPEASVKVVRQR
jgi:hypothetical protein